MRAFSGGLNVYLSLAPKFSGISRSFNWIPLKDLDINLDNPTFEQMEALEKLKTRLWNRLILGFPNKGCPYMVGTNETQYALGAALLQKQYVKGNAYSAEIEKQ